MGVPLGNIELLRLKSDVPLCLIKPVHYFGSLEADFEVLVQNN